MPYSPGTGNPLTFRCVHCRRKHGYDGPSHPGRSDRVVFLPDKPKWQHRREGRRACSPRMRMWSVRYQCQDCGYVGWSAHQELVARWERQNEPLPEKNPWLKGLRT